MKTRLNARDVVQLCKLEAEGDLLRRRMQYALGLRGQSDLTDFVSHTIACRTIMWSGALLATLFSVFVALLVPLSSPDLPLFTLGLYGIAIFTCSANIKSTIVLGEVTADLKAMEELMGCHYRNWLFKPLPEIERDGKRFLVNSAMLLLLEEEANGPLTAAAEDSRALIKKFHQTFRRFDLLEETFDSYFAEARQRLEEERKAREKRAPENAPSATTTS